MTRYAGPYEVRRTDPSLDDNQEAVRDAFAAFFTKECPTSLVRAAEPLGFDAQLWSRLLEMGVAAMSLPAELGGDDATTMDLVLIAEEWGRRLGPVPLASHVAAVRLLGRTGGAADVLSAATTGAEQICTLAHQTAASGQAQLVPDAAVATHVIALVADELCLYTSATPAVHVVNQGSTPLAWWQPDDAAERVVLVSGPSAVQEYERALAEWKLLTAAALVGLADAATQLGVEFAKTRETMGVPIGTLQGVAYPLVDAAIDVVGARTLVYKAAWTMHHEPDARPELPLMAFDNARRTATTATTTSVHVQGGLGFTTEADVSLYFLRAKGWSAIAGDPARDLSAIGAQLLATATTA